MIYAPTATCRVPCRNALAVLVVLPPHELEPAQLEERDRAVVVHIRLTRFAGDEVVHAQRDAQVPRRTVHEDVLDRELDAVRDEALGERAALVDAAMRHVALAALHDGPEHRRPRVVAGEGELGVGAGQAEQELGIAVVQATDPVADDGTDGGLVHEGPPGWMRRLLERSL